MRSFLPLLLLALLATSNRAAAAQTPPPADHREPSPRRPNIVLVLADDLGYSDLGCYGGEIRTPHLDRLAARGLRFTRFYNGARCCPTRASLMTGLYPHQAGVGRMTMDSGAQFPGYRGTLTPNTVTIAEVLRAAGYSTAMVGKWHLSLTQERPGHMKHLNNQAILDTFSDPATYPVGRGFERHYGVIWGVVNYFDPFSLVHNAEPVREVPKDFYVTDAFADEAVRVVDEFARGDAPFFLYYAPVAPHWPLHAPAADIDRYVDTYAAGWDAVRAARHRRMTEMNLLPESARAAGLPPARRRGPAWEQNPTRDWDARAMATHAAMVTRMDEGVGRLVRKLEETGRLDETLILFLSDNGASPEVYPNPGFDRPSHTRDGRKITYPPDKTIPPGGQETFYYLGPAWAEVANTPLRGHKAQTYEGGVCTPLIAHWPRGVQAKPGAVTQDAGHVVDVMATCLEVAGAVYPRTFESRAITPAEGVSLVSALRRGGEGKAERAIGWEHFGWRALRRGDWKIVARPNENWELYDLSSDPLEANDLAADNGQRVEEMSDEWERWAKRVNVYPAPDLAARR